MGINAEYMGEQVDWGKTTCLIPSTREVTIKNESFIPAPFQAFVKNPRTKFTVEPAEGTLAPQQTAVLKVTCVLDDATPHKDTLTVSVLEGDTVMVSLTAKGRGTTMFCEESLELLDFKHQFTALQCSRRFLLENKGRRLGSIVESASFCYDPSCDRMR